MNHSDFKPNMCFWMSGKRYRTADVGKKIITAVHWNPGEKRPVVIVSYGQAGKRTERHTTRKVTLRDLRGDLRDGGDVIVYWFDMDACFKRRPKWMEIRK